MGYLSALSRLVILKHVPAACRFAPLLDTCPASQVLLLASSPCVLIEMPLNVSLFVVQCASPNLEQSHAHPWSDLCQLHSLISGLDENVMSYFDCVVVVLEGHNSIADLCRAFPWWKQMLDYLHDPLAEFRGEALKD